MSIQERVDQVQGEVLLSIAEVRLLGEIELDDQARSSYRELIRDLFRFGRDPCREAPETVALMVVDLAKRTSNGLEIWPPVLDSLVPESFPDRPSFQRLQHTFGETLENVLRVRKLPTFSHLVSDGAARFRTPALAHSLIPYQLLSAYMEKVVSPSLSNGWTATDIQAWLDTNPPAGLPLAVQRFVIHGGDVARDFVDRTVDYTRSVATRAPDSGAGVPGFIQQSIKDWVLSGQLPSVRRETAQRRNVRPYLQFDYGTNEVSAVLPYTERAEDQFWVVSGEPGLFIDRVPAYEPVWARRSERRAVPIDTPFSGLRVSLTDANGNTVDSQVMPSLTKERPALFFHAATGRAFAGEFLDGNDWYMLRPDEAEVTSDGVISCLERLEPPFGWHGYAIERLEATGAERVSVAVAGVSANWRLRAEEPKPEIEARGTPVPPYIESLDSDHLALEGSLPVVCIPSGSAPGDRRSLNAWQLTAVNDSGLRSAASPIELNASFDGHRWVVPLEELIPDEDVGTWDLTVRGPLGQYLSARLALLPSDFAVVECPPEPQFVGTKRTVKLATNASVTVLEHGDRATGGRGVWTLEDRNKNGRIPVAIVDPRSGRESRCLINLPTVEWQWAPDLAPWNEKTVLSDNAITERELRLRVRSNTPVRLGLRCVQGGTVLQEVVLKGGVVRAGEFLLSQFSSTVMAMAGAMCHFELGTRLNWADLPTFMPVGAVVRPVPVRNLRAEFERGQLRFRWQQAASYPEMTASLSMRWRPWEDPADVDVEHGGGLSAVFDVPPQLSGPASLEIRALDDWVGEVTLSRRSLTLRPTMTASYVASLPATVEGRLERALATAVGQPRCPDLDTLAIAIADARALNSLVQRLGWSIERGCTEELAALPWANVAASLANAKFNPLPLLESVAAAPADQSLFRLLCAIGVPRWRSISRHRGEVSGDCRRALWARCRPLGAFLDLDDSAHESGLRRAEDYLGKIDGSSVRRQAIQLAVGFVPMKGFAATRSSLDGWRSQVPATPHALFSESGFAAACAGDLETLQRDDRTGEADRWVTEHSLNLDAMAKNIAGPRSLGWDAVGSRRPRNEAGLGLLPWASVVVAMWERRIARGRVVDRAVGPGNLAGLSAALARFAPRIYERDLCLAEAILAGR